MGTVTIFLKVTAAKREEFLQTIASLSSDLEQEKGFKKCFTYQDVNNPNVFHLVEEWRTNDDLEDYLKSAHFRVLIGTLKVLCKESEIRYHMISPSMGDLVHAL